MEELLLKDFRPINPLKLKRTVITKAKFPVIDAHTHMNSEIEDGMDEVLKGMDEKGIKTILNLNGTYGEELKRIIDKYQNKYPGKIYTLCNIDFSDIDSPGFSKSTENLIKEAKKAGAVGIKLYKTLGLKVKDSKGDFVLPDDDRLRALWETAASESIPVLYHIADPVTFFQSVDGKNEKYEKLCIHPDWIYDKPSFPTFDKLMESQRNLVRKNSETYFVHPHVIYPENLEYVSSLMDTYSNFAVDVSARVKDLGRQPYTSREFIIKHADRVLFGTDASIKDWSYQTEWRYEMYYRFFETKDEYFDFTPPESDAVSRWKLYGLGLPDDILKKVYYENAQRIYKI